MTSVEQAANIKQLQQNERELTQTIEDLRSQLKQAENKYYLRTSEHLNITK